MYNAPEESCEDEYFDVKLALFDKTSKFWIVGNLSTNFMVNGFNGCFFFLLWWIMFGILKIV